MTNSIGIIGLRDIIEKSGLTHQQAEAIAIAIDTRIEAQDNSEFATKGDIHALKTNIQELKTEMKDLELRLTSKLYTLHIGSMAVILGVIAKMLGKW